MAEIDLLRRYPRAKRNIEKRTVAQNEENIRIAWQYGREYFDGSWDTGYGGYRYDGRWLSIAEDMIAHFGLKPGDRVLDVGACKGFLVKDLKKACPDLEAFGLNISEYALMHCEPEVVGGCISGIASNCRSPTAALRRRTRSMSSTISIAPSASQRCARSSGCRSDAPTSGRSVQHARPEGDFPQLGADSEDASRPCRLASPV